MHLDELLFSHGATIAMVLLKTFVLQTIISEVIQLPPAQAPTAAEPLPRARYTLLQENKAKDLWHVAELER